MMEEFFRGKDILITGGCGSIGSELAKQLLKFSPKLIRIFDQNESAHFNMQMDLENNPLIRHLVGSVREKQRLYRAFENVDIIFHAAAMKHVPLSEYNPYEAVLTNVVGTQNIIEVAREKKVKKVIFISTDKAVNPINTMGATKLLGEKLILAADPSTHITAFSCVRFGNVLNSVGSVVPIFRKQIKNGGPVTVTDENMTRFFMSMSSSVRFVLKAASIANGGELFILKMPSLKIKDLATAMVEELAPHYGHNSHDIEVKIIGTRPGEKFHEALFTSEEAPFVRDIGDMFVIQSWINVPHIIKNTRSQEPIRSEGYISNSVPLLDVSQIKEVLRRENLK